VAQRRHHYEQAFEHYLRSRRIPYVSVNEAKKALLPEGARLRRGAEGGASPPALKSFDFVVYGEDENLLLDVKGRRIPRRGGRRVGASPRGRLESWVTLDDIESMRSWEGLFGEGFAAAFVFVYWCDEQPPDGLYQEIFERHGRWYAVRAVRLDEYLGAMRTRSARWRTVHVPTAAFERISMPFCPPGSERGGEAPATALHPLGASVESGA
jgi:hypothetical protein